MFGLPHPGWLQILQNSSHLLWNTAFALTLRVKTQSCLSSSHVSIVIPFFVLDKFDFYFWNPLWLPGLLPQLILLIMSHFPLHSWAESAFSLLSAHCWIVFFSRLFMAAFTLHQLLRSQSTVPTFTFIYSVFLINYSLIPSYPAHHLLEEFFTRIHAVPPYFFFKILPCYKFVLNLVMLRSYSIHASQRCPKGHLAFSSQRLEFKYKLSGITFQYFLSLYLKSVLYIYRNLFCRKCLVLDHAEDSKSCLYEKYCIITMKSNNCKKKTKVFARRVENVDIWGLSLCIAHSFCLQEIPLGWLGVMPCSLALSIFLLVNMTSKTRHLLFYMQ